MTTLVASSAVPLADSDRPIVARAEHQLSRPKISVLIPVLNDATGLARCLKSIQANGYPSELLEVIVADNGSTDGSGETAVVHGAKVVELPGLSVADVRNRLAEMATGDVLAFIDADHEVSSDWFRSAAETLRQPAVAAVGAPYHPPADGTWVQRLYDGFRAHAPHAVDTRWLGSGNLAVWASAFKSIGGFDTSLVTCEDVDCCQRLRRYAGRLITDERLRSVHHGDPRSLRQLFTSELWRGRDNLLVSFRGPMGLRELPSIAIPIVVLLSLMSLPVAVVVAANGLWTPLVIALALLIGAPASRAVAMIRRLRALSLTNVMQAFMVAATYDVARALAIVVRKGHRRAA